MDKEISYRKVCEELEDYRNVFATSMINISEIDKENDSFIATLHSKIDKEKYILKVKFDDYDEIPPLFEFIDPTTMIPGTRNAYPTSMTDGFFHHYPAICHPCSRKAYAGYSGIDSGWICLGWKNHSITTGINNINAMLLAIHVRINDKSKYGGRMK